MLTALRNCLFISVLLFSPSFFLFIKNQLILLTEIWLHHIWKIDQLTDRQQTDTFTHSVFFWYRYTFTYHYYNILIPQLQQVSVGRYYCIKNTCSCRYLPPVALCFDNLPHRVAYYHLNRFKVINFVASISFQQLSLDFKIFNQPRLTIEIMCCSAVGGLRPWMCLGDKYKYQ